MEIDFEVQLNRLWSVDCERLYAVESTPNKPKVRLRIITLLLELPQHGCYVGFVLKKSIKDPCN